MFNLFKKSNQSQPLKHAVFLNKTGKYRHLISTILENKKKNEKTLLVYYFDNSGTYLQELFKATKIRFVSDSLNEVGELFLFSAEHLESILKSSISKPVFNSIIVSEIHPMGGKDEMLNQLFNEHIPGAEKIFYTSLDAPFFSLFGGDRTIEIMKKLDAKEDELLEHSLISKSIINAQEKIKSKITFEKKANSESEWLNLNYNPA